MYLWFMSIADIELQHALYRTARRVQELVPSWSHYACCPSEALVTGTGNCLARSIIACALLDNQDFPVDLRIHKRHPLINPKTGIINLGHALVSAQRTSTGVTPVINSDKLGQVWVEGRDPTRLEEGYMAPMSIEETVDVYLSALSDEGVAEQVSLDGLKGLSAAVLG